MKEWQDNFKGKSSYWQGKSHCCGVLIAYLGNKTFVVKNKIIYVCGCLLVLDVTIDNQDYILINVYNANT